ncbi:HAD-IB family hydrolase [Flavihumibacter fluvii]|uniref:HAD-IB family hydrolase n=1 Tax=Flavihumibacter fluvii TaxID=2838157 RepID=UPI001BDEB036|nr:HAD-IB family hydrolase [Flavihumibacter fluvii]ULQ52768.1 HAD-IB family hydrolase [Flavihumibacter fluvii]
MNKSIAFFDFDGTITTRDTMLELIRHSKGDARFYAGFLFLSPLMVAMKLKLLSNTYVKERFLSYFFGGIDAEHFQQLCNRFIENKLPALIREQAMAAIKEHHLQQTEVVIVSASASNWISKWCEQHNITCISSAMEISGGKITGKLQGPNVHGQEKVRKIKNAYDLNVYQRIYCYGDTGGDLPMLELATDRFYKPFR